MDRARDLKQRLALATPDKTCRGIFLKGILQVVKSLGDASAVQQCLDARLEAILTAGDVKGAKVQGWQTGLVQCECLFSWE